MPFRRLRVLLRCHALTLARPGTTLPRHGAVRPVWRRADVGPYQGGFRRVPPVLAVKVAGRYERERQLREKARWYLEASVPVVWIVLPKKREVLAAVLRAEEEARADPALAPCAAYAVFRKRRGRPAAA